MKRKEMLLTAGALLIACSGCKTTVNNYREAYDIAQQKRAETTVDVVVPGTNVQRDDDALLQLVNGDSVPVRVAVCSTIEGPRNPFAIVTARFKMSTNALASYREYAKSDSTATLLLDTEEQYLVSPCSFRTLGEAAARFKKMTGAKKAPATPGLNSGPYIVRIPRR